MKHQIAFGNTVAAIALSLLASHQDYLGKGLLTNLAKYGGVASLGLMIISRHEKHELKISDYLQGVKTAFEEASEFVYETGVTDWVADQARIVIEPFSSMPTFGEDPSYAPLERLGVGSYAIYAGKGKGKSQLFVYLCRQFARAGADVKIGDSHAPKTRVDYGEYFPGIEPAKYLATEYTQILELYRTAEKILDQRRKDWKSKEDQAQGRDIVIAVEEFNTFISQLSEEQAKEVCGIIERIENEARWYKIYNVITTKSLKNKNTGIDSTVLSQMDWLVLQGGFDDPNTRFLEGFDRKAVSQKQKDLDGFAVAHYEAGSSRVDVFKLPDNAEFGQMLLRQSESMSFVEGDRAALYLESHREDILKELRLNPSAAPTAIAQILPSFGRKSKDNPKWEALKVFLEELREVVNQEIDEQSPFNLEVVV